VIANRCGSAHHAELLAEALSAASLPPLAGGIAQGGLPELSSRHLGLVTADARNLSAGVLSALADGVERGIKLDALLALARNDGGSEFLVPGSWLQPGTRNQEPGTVVQRVRLGLAWDEAFHFYYPDNLEALEAAGVELVRFSPIRDARLPEGLDGLYLGGGYPEVHAEALAANRPMLEGVRALAASGRPVYAECGGLMYLSEGVRTLDGRRHALAGVVPAETRMLRRCQALGHVEVALAEDAVWGPKGALCRGHEFHYSELASDPAAGGSCRRAYVRQPVSRGVIRGEGFLAGSVLASYVHLHLASRPETIRHLVAALAGARTKERCA
jgi:cobyrinic acid a,c-diamide synthase